MAVASNAAWLLGALTRGRGDRAGLRLASTAACAVTAGRCQNSSAAQARRHSGPSTRALLQSRLQARAAVAAVTAVVSSGGPIARQRELALTAADSSAATPAPTRLSSEWEVQEPALAETSAAVTAPTCLSLRLRMQLRVPSPVAVSGLGAPFPRLFAAPCAPVPALLSSANGCQSTPGALWAQRRAKGWWSGGSKKQKNGKPKPKFIKVGESMYRVTKHYRVLYRRFYGRDIPETEQQASLRRRDAYLRQLPRTKVSSHPPGTRPRKK
eukprot:TRINITY_DN73164_c0_g1_i1.p1 TRINITY_DN73164_c0_g1~~TRINITY_DN73164_c0_g1_i1.p1  ORF type:complete len:298 (+),score=52.02 TRINITY_DN73164_c0_g1_i1:90-896(+)